MIKWIETDNKELILYVDTEMIDSKHRTTLCINILNEYKELNIRYGNAGESRYEILMKFGYSKEMVEYLIIELSVIKTFNAHTINLLSAIRYINWYNLSITNENLAQNLSKQLFNVIRLFISNEGIAFYLFLPFEHPYLCKKENIDHLYPIIKDSTNIDIINGYISLILKAKITDDYVDYILDKSQYINNYNSGNTIYITSHTYLLQAYNSISTYENLQKVLNHILNNHLENDCYYESNNEYEEMIKSLLKLAVKLYPDHPDIENIVYECFISNSKECCYFDKRNSSMLYIDFFAQIGKKEDYYNKVVTQLISLFQNTDNVSPNVDTFCFSASLFLNKEKTDTLFNSLKDAPYTYSLLSWLYSYATGELKDYIKEKEKAIFPSLYQEPQVTPYELKRLKDLEDLFSYETFKAQVVKVIKEKSPYKRDDLRRNRQANIENEESINDYIYSLFNHFFKEGYYHLEEIEDSINNKDKYNIFLLVETISKLYPLEAAQTLSKKQRNILYNIAKERITKITSNQIFIHHNYRYPSLDILLHKDIQIEKHILLKLLPYSYYQISIKDNKPYYLFEYIVEQKEVTTEDVSNALFKLLENPAFKVVDQNRILWTAFFVQEKQEEGYKYSIQWSQKSNEFNTFAHILEPLLQSDDSRRIITNENVFNKYSTENKLHILNTLVSIKNYNYGWIKEYLEPRFIMYSKDHKITAIRILLQVGSLRAIRYLNENKEYFHINTDFFFNYSYIEALPYLKGLLADVLSKDKEGHSIEYILSSLISSIEKIALCSKSNFEQVNKCLNDIIGIDKEKYSYLNYHLKEWKIKLLGNKTTPITIENVMNILKEND